MNLSSIIIDIVFIAIVVVPVILGLKKGFIYTLLHFGKSLIAFGVATAFVEPLAAWLKNKFLYSYIHDNISTIFEDGAMHSQEDLVGAVPEGIKGALDAIGMNVDEMANEALSRGEETLDAFVETLSQSVSSVLGFIIAFSALFVATLILIFILRPLINWIVTHLPVVRTFNSVLGGVFGLFLGFIFAWVGAQLFVGVSGLVAFQDWTGSSVLTFFYEVTPIRWLLGLAAKSIAGLSVIQ